MKLTRITGAEELEFNGSYLVLTQDGEYCVTKWKGGMFEQTNHPDPMWWCLEELKGVWMLPQQ